MRFIRMIILLVLLLTIMPGLYAQDENEKKKDPELDWAATDTSFSLGAMLWGHLGGDFVNKNVNYGIDRLYVTGKKDINDNVGFRFIFEGYAEGEGASGSGNRYGASFKQADLYARIRFGKFRMKGFFGIIETPYIAYMGRITRDFQFNSDPVAKNSITPGYDLGLGFCMAYGQIVSLNFTATNGMDNETRGYKDLTPSNGDFLYSTRLSVTPINEIIITAWYAHNTHVKGATNEGVGMWAAGLAWRDPMLTGGINFAMEVVGRNNMIMDVWINYNLKKVAGFPLKLYLNYNALDFEDHEISGGVGYEFAPSTDITLYYTSAMDAGALKLHFTTMM